MKQGSAEKECWERVMVLILILINMIIYLAFEETHDIGGGGGTAYSGVSAIVRNNREIRVVFTQFPFIIHLVKI